MGEQYEQRNGARIQPGLMEKQAASKRLRFALIRQGAAALVLAVLLTGSCRRDDDDKPSKDEKALGALLLLSVLFPRFTFSCDFRATSGLCYNLNSNAGPYDCTGLGGTRSTSPCLCDMTVSVGSCARSPSSTVYYTGIFTAVSAQTQCANAGGTFSNSCPAQ